MTKGDINKFQPDAVQRSTYKFFHVAILLFAVQVLAGILTVHDFVGFVRFFGFDISDDTYNACVKETEIMRTCFLGNPDKYRSLFITELAQSGIEIDVYGNSWGKFVDHKNIKVHDVVYEDEFWRTLRKYRVQLNLMRPHNPDAHNMRTFEVPGIGGIQLAPVTVDHQTYFDPGREIFLFKNNLECQVEIAALLALRTDAANNIRESARTRSLRSCYSYKDRAKEVSNYFQEFFA